jgi:glyoxylase-like metal-dependent hydrolase (beta-lactamase superfamily II)
MTSGGVEEIVAGIWRWERRPRALRPSEFGSRTSYAVVIESEVLLLDPLVDGDDDPALDVLDDLVRGRVRILVTMPYHTRSSESLWRRYRGAKARIYGHPAVATRLGDVSGFEAVAGGAEVAGIARFHSIGRPPRSQQPIEIPDVQALAFGDAVVDTGGGELRVWAAPLDTEQRRRRYARYLPTLERLAGVDLEHILVTHGRPAIGDGKAALQRALASAPWQRPKRGLRRTSSQR